MALCCSEGAQEPAASAPPATVAAAPGEASAAPADPPSSASERVAYALGRHLDRAELRAEGTLVVDFGTPAAAKYTLGGWRTRVGPDRRLGGTTATLIRGLTGELLLPSETTAAQVLRLRARAFADGRVTVYVNGEAVHHGRLPTDGTFGTLEVPIEAGALVASENVLQLRVPARGRDEGVSAGLALDWMTLGPPGAEIAPPPPLTNAPRLPDGWALGWHLEVPEGATLRARIDGEVEVTAVRDGQPARALGRHGGEVRVPLGELAGQHVRLDLRATGAATIEEPRIVVAEPTPRGAALRRPRNVIVWLVDTVRADKLSPFNPNTRVQTPGLARWARTATVFEQARTQENWTKPSVATLLSGLLPWKHTATSGEAVVPRSVTLLSETLEDAGFTTGAFVCNGYVSDKFGFEQGWDTWRNYLREGRRTAARFVAADVLSWLDERPRDRPFFLYVHTIDPHVPYIPPDDILARYDPEPYAGPVDFRRDRELLEKIKSGRLRLGERDRRRLEALYDGEITYHDAHFAAVLEGLERRGLADETMVVFTADHGEEMFDHGSVGHGHSLFEELLHVPLVVRLPGVEGGRVRAPVGLVDVMPTVLEALGQPVPEELQGQSALRLMRGDAPDAPRPSLAGFMDGWRSIVLGRFKLIQRTHRHWMLFDLVADPREEHDLAAQRPLVVRHLRGMLGLAMHGAERGARHQAGETTIDPQTRAQLEALGYVGGQPR